VPGRKADACYACVCACVRQRLLVLVCVCVTCDEIVCVRAPLSRPERAISGALGQGDAGDVPAVQGVAPAVVKTAICGIASALLESARADTAPDDVMKQRPCRVVSCRSVCAACACGDTHIHTHTHFDARAHTHTHMHTHADTHT
jgi:hypothetical protein